MLDISQYRSLKTKEVGPSGSPARYLIPGSVCEEGTVTVEVYPQNCWSHITPEKLLIEGWNDEHNDHDRVEDRLRTADISDSWMGIKTREQLDRLLRVGDTENPIQISQELGQSIANLSKQDKRRRKKWINNEEGDLIVEAYANRDPEVFYAKRRTEGKKHLTNLIVATGGNCTVSAQTLRLRSAVYAKIVDELQRQGHNVALYALDPIIANDRVTTIIWEIKRHHEQMSIPAMQRDLGHPAVYRTAVFDIIGALPYDPGYGLGSTCTRLLTNVNGNYTERRKVVADVIKSQIGDPSVVLNLFNLNDNIDEEELTKILPRIAKTLNNLVTQPKSSGVHFINYNDKES